MKIERKTVTIKLGEVGDEATLVFNQLKNNARARVAYVLGKAKDAKDRFEMLNLYAEYESTVLAACQSVENLFEDGCAVSLESVRAGALYPETVNAILSAYFLALNPSSPEAEEKKDSGSGSLNA